MVCYLQVENLTKSYGELVMFDRISFAINEGERIALIARNGAGKSTTIGCLLNMVKADSGSIKILGRETAKLTAEDK